MRVVSKTSLEDQLGKLFFLCSQHSYRLRYMGKWYTFLHHNNPRRVSVTPAEWHYRLAACSIMKRRTYPEYKHGIYAAFNNPFPHRRACR